METRRLRADLIEVFKKMKGYEGLAEQKLWERRVGNTRGHSFKIFKRAVRLDIGKYSFGNRVCDDWNDLPVDVVNASSVNVFKGRLDQYLGKVREFK